MENCGRKWWKSAVSAQVMHRIKEVVIIMFMGEYSHSIDAKGRLIMPAKFREQLGDTFIITKSPDKCLYIYTSEDWKRFENKLATLPITNKETRQFVRFFLAGAAECEVDKQGRFLIPSILRNYAELDKEAILAGAAGKIEIWNKERYLADQKEYENNIDEIAANMEKFGFSI